MRDMQCEKALYLDTFRHRLAEIKPKTLRAFDAGRQFERSVKETFPEAHDLGSIYGSNLGRYVQATTELLQQPGTATIFEAGFMYDGMTVLADVLCRDERGEIDIYEIKNNSRAKEVFRQDLFVQYYVICHALKEMPVAEGMKQHLRTFSLALKPVELSEPVDGKDNDAAPPSPILYQRVEQTSEAVAELPVVTQRIAHFQDILRGTEPAVEMGEQCDTPYECPFKNYCLGNIPVQLELSF